VVDAGQLAAARLAAPFARVGTESDGISDAVECAIAWSLLPTRAPELGGQVSARHQKDGAESVTPTDDCVPSRMTRVCRQRPDLARGSSPQLRGGGPPSLL
jgi:hypothetical protein